MQWQTIAYKVKRNGPKKKLHEPTVIDLKEEKEHIVEFPTKTHIERRKPYYQYTRNLRETTHLSSCCVVLIQGRDGWYKII